jgi:hypothetical protein
MLHLSSAALIRRIRYRHGLPFIMSVILAVVTTSRFQPSRPTSIWTFALLALISTAFTLLCGGRFRTFFIAIAVTPPFLFAVGWVLRMRSVLYLPGKAVGEYFLYFVAAPILLVWVVSTVLSRTERHA